MERFVNDPATTLTNSINNTATTIQVASAVGYPIDGVPFFEFILWNWPHVAHDFYQYVPSLSTHDSLVFQYIVQANDVCVTGQFSWNDGQINLNGGTIKNLDGSDANFGQPPNISDFTAPWSFN